MGSKHPRMDTAVKVLQQTILVSLFYNVLLPKVHFLCWDLGEKSKVHLSAQQNEGTTVNALGTNELTNFKKRFAIPNRLRCPTGYWNLTLQWEFTITLKVALVAYSSLHSCSTKLEVYGFNKSSVKWFHSYLSERTQIVNIGNEMSDPVELTLGSPQGSILSPSIFIILLSDIELYCPEATCVHTLMTPPVQ